MRILILHGLDDVATARRTSVNHAFFLPRYAPEHDYWLHSAGQPVTAALRNAEFDVIILDTTFLCNRWAKPAQKYFLPLKEKYAFVRDASAVKIAYPQDEYDHSAVLDEWLDEWRVDVIYSVCFSQAAEFYPRSGRRAHIRQGFTGLYDPADAALVRRFARPFSERPLDVGYRARRLPPCFGWFGQLKADIADRFSEAAGGSGLRIDISCDDHDAITGDRWLVWLGSCKFILGCESGSSLQDPVGDFRRRCEQYLARRPLAGFAEVEAACFPGSDRAIPFAALSPRVFEAAAAGCAQILVPGDYAGVLKPWEHYIPLAPDASNFSEVRAAICDVDRVRLMIDRSRDALLNDPRFTYVGYAADALSAVRSVRAGLAAPGFAGEPVDVLIRLALSTGERWSGALAEATPRSALGRAVVPALLALERHVLNVCSRTSYAVAWILKRLLAREIGPIVSAARRSFRKRRS